MRNHTRHYPRLSAEPGGDDLVAHAGTALLVRTAEATGLATSLSKALAPFRKPLASHDPGKIVCDLAISLAAGGDCLVDIAALRDAPAVFGPVASDPRSLPADRHTRRRRRPGRIRDPRGTRRCPVGRVGSVARQPGRADQCR